MTIKLFPIVSALLTSLFLCACATAATVAPTPVAEPALYPNETPELRALINEYAELNALPPDLVHRLAIRESTHRPHAKNGPYYGLLQILPATARSMGFQGAPKDLLDAETNLKYALRYLKGAYMLSDGDHDAAIKWYARGYWHEAKRQGKLVETGLVQR